MGSAVVVALRPSSGTDAVTETGLNSAVSNHAQVGRFTFVVSAGASSTSVEGTRISAYASWASISGVMASATFAGGGSPLSTQKIGSWQSSEPGAPTWLSGM
ncbi:M57 family metalloprotease [Streptomyces sp. MMCC 100]|uniref:M57 family metalloprotease n=1 Tax=Streptomyces sp. MMCC 100 TaxID=3163555 RepID=UPI00359A3071